jgi:Tol biopolymer transport system component
VYPTYDIFTANPDGSGLKQLTNTPGYDAETTITRDGKKLVFTSMRDGDLDIYTMDADGKNVRRLTNELGYDGGPFWSYDGKQIVYRAYHPTSDKDKTELHRAAKTKPDSPQRARDLGDECRWVEQTPGHAQRQSQLRPLLLS